MTVTVNDIVIRLEHDVRMYAKDVVNWDKKMLNRSDPAIYLANQSDTPRGVAQTAITTAEYIARYEYVKRLYDDIIMDIEQ